MHARPNNLLGRSVPGCHLPNSHISAHFPLPFSHLHPPQVGYADSQDDLPAQLPTRSASLSHNQLLKQRLAAQAAGGAAGQGGRRGAAAARSADPLADLLK